MLLLSVYKVVYISRVAQLEDSWQIESQPRQIDEKLSQGLRPKQCTHNKTVGMLKIYFCPSFIVQVLRLPGAVSLPNYIVNSRRSR